MLNPYPFRPAMPAYLSLISLPQTRNVKETVIMPCVQVLYVQSAGDHVCKVVAQRSPSVQKFDEFSICRNLCYFTGLLPHEFFAQIHRSYLVNIFFVIGYNKTDSTILMADRKILPIARRQLPEFKKLLFFC